MDVPFIPIRLNQDVQSKEDQLCHSVLLQLIEKAKNDKTGKSIKKYENKIKGSNILITSWRFNEWDYYSKKIHLPIYARGLFTIDASIACRGYDKFFNINELSKVREENLQNDTIGPYTITVKSNGCIILISGTSTGELIVCSKHSTGERMDLSKNHAVVAQNVLENQLHDIGITPAQFAIFLHDWNITALCEYCDDEFEEHVLEYKNEKAGLYLHGLNLNTVTFRTYPIEQVNAFAKLFGFKETPYVTKSSFEETMDFVKSCDDTGCYNGEEIEGFVIRCKAKNNNEDFFFKYKFEEPYQLYREMREITKQLIINGTENLKFGKHKLICMDYIKFIIPLLSDNEILKREYMENKGIIELRKTYFQSKNTTIKEMINAELNMVELEEDMKLLKFGKEKPNKYIFVTVATIGCGKTTTSQTLCSLFPDLIGHVQNDNIQGSGKFKLIEAALEVLKTKDLVIVDKNNHKIEERKQFFQVFNQLNNFIPREKLKFVCLNFLQRSPKGDKSLWELTRNRIVNRGDNHQSIKASSDGIKSAEGIMKGFINRYQELNPSNPPDSFFDLIIDLDVTNENSSLLNAQKIVEIMSSFADIKWNVPTDDQYAKAFEAAKTYHPEFTKIIKKNPEKNFKHSISYFGINVAPDFTILENIDFFTSLKNMDRVQNNFHVTIIHSSMKKGNPENAKIWKFYENILLQSKIPLDTKEPRHFINDFTFDVKPEKIVWNETCMCIQVKIMQCFNQGKPVEVDIPVLFPHITIGTIDPSIAPVNAGLMLSDMYNFDGKANTIDISNTPILERQPLMAFLNVK